MAAAFSGFYESHGPTPSSDVCGIVPAHRHGHRNGQQSGHILHCCFVFCHPGGCRGNTERVVPRWRSKGSSSKTSMAFSMMSVKLTNKGTHRRADVIGMVMAQVLLKAALKKWGREAEESVGKEM